MSHIEPDLFRQVLAHMPTGITIITANGPDGPVGMAANSVASVSLDPPLMLFCPAKGSKTWPVMRSAGTFCMNVMAGHHEPLTRQMSAREGDRFAGVAFEQRPAGPSIPDANAWIDCELQDEHDAGDHTIVVARVLAIEAGAPGEPLVFFRGRYGSFLAPDLEFHTHEQKGAGHGTGRG